MSAAADILTLFSEKSQKPNSAHKCPITSIQVCIESQKLPEFSRITFGSLNRGCPPFQPLCLKITKFWSWGCTMGGGGHGRISATLLARPMTRSSLRLYSCGLIHVYQLSVSFSSFHLFYVSRGAVQQSIKKILAFGKRAQKRSELKIIIKPQKVAKKSLITKLHLAHLKLSKNQNNSEILSKAYGINKTGQQNRTGILIPP